MCSLVFVFNELSTPRFKFIASITRAINLFEIRATGLFFNSEKLMLGQLNLVKKEWYLHIIRALLIFSSSYWNRKIVMYIILLWGSCE